MTEEDARSWLRSVFGAAAEERLAHFAELLEAENTRQNLISTATLASVWSRHLVDSAQLLPLASDTPGLWVDIGSGAGLPGIVVALLSDRPVTLVEPRRLRVEFLERSIAALRVTDRVRVVPARSDAARLPAPAAVISARAVAALPLLLETSSHLADEATLWVLPKGRAAASEVADARKSWQGEFHVEPSITDPGAGIVIIRGVRRR
jgi:16S rRNA (guanine527-N7)-methyltransferase